MYKNVLFVVMYLVSIVGANLIVGHFGPSSAIIVAFFFIGLDLSSRDFLHENWKHNRLLKLGILIAAGSLISYLMNRSVANIAIASTFAFTWAAIADTFMYSLLNGQPRLWRINGSNVVSAVADTLVFVILAFGFPILWGVVFGQIVAKIVGGFVWAFILTSFNKDA